MAEVLQPIVRGSPNAEHSLEQFQLANPPPKVERCVATTIPAVRLESILVSNWAFLMLFKKVRKGREKKWSAAEIGAELCELASIGVMQRKFDPQKRPACVLLSQPSVLLMDGYTRRPKKDARDASSCAGQGCRGTFELNRSGAHYDDGRCWCAGAEGWFARGYRSESLRLAASEAWLARNKQRGSSG